MLPGLRIATLGPLRPPLLRLGTPAADSQCLYRETRRKAHAGAVGRASYTVSGFLFCPLCLKSFPSFFTP